MHFSYLCAALMVLATTVGCTRYRNDLDTNYNVEQSWELEEIPYGVITQFETVFWEPDDTISLRQLIVESQCANGRKVLEIGTGTGIISILCLRNGADKVVATDINPAAVDNAKYNAAMLADDMPLDVRLVDSQNPGAFAVIEPKERFDLIISNPPWEDGTVNGPADHAFIDPNFALMDSLLDGLPRHLNPGGRCLLAYGHVPSIKRLQEEVARRGLELKILDQRTLDDLQTDFLPGMLIEVTVPINYRRSGTPQKTASTSNEDSTD